MTDHEIVDPALYRAILHAVAAGACRAAARETGDLHWARQADDQRAKATAMLDRRLVRNV